MYYFVKAVSFLYIFLR